MTTISSSPSPSLCTLLGDRFRLRLTDGRTLLGNFTAIDRQGNLVLDHALEYPPASASASLSAGEGGGEGLGEAREVGLVLVPQRHWAKVEREVPAGAVEEAKAGGCVPS